MTEQDVQVYDERSKTLTGKSHAKTTKTCYGSYWNALKQWLPLHIPAYRDADGNLDEHLLREWVETHLEEARVKFLRFLSSRKHRCLTFEDDSPMPAKAGSLRGYCSTFTFHVWLKHGETKPAEWSDSLQGFHKGAGVDDAERRQRGEMSAMKGKSHMVWDLCVALAVFFIEEGDPQCWFGNVWSWNLMCRCFNVAELCMNAFGWSTDAITVQFAQVKTKKDGENILVKHVYANPFQPEVLPRLPRLPKFLSLAPITPIAAIDE